MPRKSNLRPIVGYAILTPQATVTFQRGPEFPKSVVCYEVLSCGHTNYTPKWEGKIQTAQARRCAKCADEKPADVTPAQRKAWGI